MKSLIINIDKKLSSILHYADNFILSFILYPFAALFHPRMIWIVFVTIFYVSNFDLQYTAIYGIASGIVGIGTWILKRFFKRIRPDMVQNVQKSKRFRTKQKNYSMPSGDSIQAGAFSMFLYALGVRLQIIIIFQILVCMSRVYFMCHWLLDTVVGTLFGCGISWFFVKFIELNPWILNIFDYFLTIGYQWLHIIFNKKNGQL